MKNTISLILALSLFILNACSSKSEINGSIENAPKQGLRLEELAFDENKLIDTASVGENGTFQIAFKGSEEALYRIKFSEGKYVLLALAPGDNVSLKGNWNSLENYSVEGSKSSMTLKGFLVNLRENVTDLKTMKMISDSLRARQAGDSVLKEAEADIALINTRFMDYVKKFADTTQSVSSALFAANIINPAYETPFLNQFYQNITKRFPASTVAKQFANAFNTKNNAAPSDIATPAAGNAAPDFSAATPDGTNITLSSFKGKYVLLDFWAAWCGPCRKENPNVVKAYMDFKDKNFTVIGVSLDTNKEKWEDAIKTDNLSWTQVSELKGWASSIARNYQVNSIPANFLIDPNGNIIASNLRGQALHDKLSEVLNNPQTSSAKPK